MHSHFRVFQLVQKSTRNGRATPDSSGVKLARTLNQWSWTLIVVPPGRQAIYPLTLYFGLRQAGCRRECCPWHAGTSALRRGGLEFRRKLLQLSYNHRPMVRCFLCSVVLCTLMHTTELSCLKAAASREDVLSYWSIARARGPAVVDVIVRCIVRVPQAYAVRLSPAFCQFHPLHSGSVQRLAPRYALGYCISRQEKLAVTKLALLALPLKYCRQLPQMLLHSWLSLRQGK